MKYQAFATFFSIWLAGTAPTLAVATEANSVLHTHAKRSRRLSRTDADLIYGWRRIADALFEHPWIWQTMRRDSPLAVLEARGLNVQADPSFIKMDLGEVALAGVEGLFFGWEPRLGVAVDQAQRDTGMLASLTNSIHLVKILGRSARLSFKDSPVLHVYSRTADKNTAAAKANPLFENELTLGFETDIGALPIRFLLPFHFLQVKHHAHRAKAELNDAVQNFAWFSPELDYYVADTSRFVLSYVSESVITDNLESFRLTEALGRGTVEFSFHSSL